MRNALLEVYKSWMDMCTRQNMFISRRSDILGVSEKPRNKTASFAVEKTRGVERTGIKRVFNIQQGGV